MSVGLTFPPYRSRPIAAPDLTPEQQAKADRIFAGMLHAAEGDLRELAELLASKDDTNKFGATEFTVRDIVLRVRAKAVQTALAEPTKGCRTGGAAPAPEPARRPSSSGGRGNRC